MTKDQLIGALILIGSIAGIVIYGWLVGFSPWPVITVQVTAFLGIAAILAILAWIGWTLATTPAPTPIEETPLETPAEEEKPAGEEGSEEEAPEKKEEAKLVKKKKSS